MSKKRFHTIVLVIVACVIGYLFLLPLLFMVFTSFKSLSEALGSSTLLPQQWTLRNYRDLLSNLDSAPIGKWMRNTAVVTALGTLLRLFTSTLAAYALARLAVPAKRFIMLCLVCSIAIPEIVTIFPLFYMFKEAALLNTFWPLILPSGAGMMTIYLLYNFLLDFPRALEEAAFIDGANVAQILWRVVVPSVRPVLITQGFITFLGLYNTYLWPSLVINRTEMRTLTLGIAAMVLGENYVNPGLMMAATVTAVLPVLLIFIVLNRYIVKGHTLSGVK